MNKIGIFCTDNEVNNKIIEYCNIIGIEFEPDIIQEVDKCIEYVNYELPELCLYNFSDAKLDTYKILEKIKSDPWLHYGGIIGLYSTREDKDHLDKIKYFNLISLIQKSRFDAYFPRVLKIIKKNRQILFQRHIQNQFLSNISGKFIIDNDPFEAMTCANMIANYLFNANYIDRSSKEQLIVTLQELLINAIEHGNCKISYNEKSEWLNSRKNILDLIKEKNRNSEIRKKKVYFTYTINPEKSGFIIKDEGDGFDWKKRKQLIQENDKLELHGRGIIMAEIYVSQLLYNEIGNEVHFEIQHKKDEQHLIPQAFNSEKEVVFENNEIIFEENEKSNFLYYIVSGKLSIISNNKIISYLTPADIFVGDMSFLLNNRRSVTVKSKGKTVLLKISKESFLDAIKKQPYYGIFLARLIAQRLNRLNQISVNKVQNVY